VIIADIQIYSDNKKVIMVNYSDKAATFCKYLSAALPQTSYMD